MSLALVKVNQSEFDFIYGHLIARQPRYQNMHLREACQRGGQRDLRYLHAMHAQGDNRPEIEGVISGPELVWHYKLVSVRFGTQLNVLADRASTKERARIGRRFITEIMARIAEEQKAGTYSPKRTPGQYYLQRRVQGMPATHPVCRQAVASGVLSPLLVSRLAGWRLEVLCR